MRVARIAFIASAAWSVVASLYVLLSPLTIQEVRTSGLADGSSITEEVTRQTSWYQVQGLWGVLVLAAFALLFILIPLLALKRRYVLLLTISLIATLLVLLAGFSIGPFYLPAVVAVLVGWSAMGIGKLIGHTSSASA